MRLVHALATVPVVEGRTLTLFDANRSKDDRLSPITVEQVKGRRAYFVVDGERFSFGQDGRVYGQGGEMRVWASPEVYVQSRELSRAAFEFRKAQSDFEERATGGGVEFGKRMEVLREATDFLKTLLP